MSNKTYNELLEALKASDPFATPDGFGQIDLSGSPRFIDAKAKETETKPDPFAPRQEEYPQSLKDFIKNVDEDVISDAATRRGASPSLRAELADIEQNRVAIDFKRRADNYYASDANLEILVKALSEAVLGYSSEPIQMLVNDLHKAKAWNVETLLEAHQQIFAQGGYEDYPEGTYRPLSPQDWETVARFAMRGDFDNAVRIGLTRAFDLDNTPSDLEMVHLMNNPANRPIINGLVLHVWKAASPAFDERDADAFLEYAKSFAGDRPFGLALLNNAYAAFLKERESAERDRVLGWTPMPDVPEREDLDQLSDEQVEDLLKRTRVERARGGR